MIRRLALLTALAGSVLLPSAGPAAAAVGPLYDIKATWGDTNLGAPDDKGQFTLQVRNVGDAVGGEDLVIEDQLPAGVTVSAINSRNGSPNPYNCSGIGTTTAKCVLPAALLPTYAAPPPGDKVPVDDIPFSPKPTGNLPIIYVDVSVPAEASGEGTNTATVSGGGMPEVGSDIDQVPFGKDPAPFGLVPGSFLADFFSAAHPFGAPARQASDRPFELRVDFDLTTRTGLNDLPGQDGTRYTTPSGQVRTVEVTLPRGFIGNPEATPKCDPLVFAQVGVTLNSTACPPNTQVGYLNVMTNDGNSNYGSGNLGHDVANRVAIYNLEPPRGALADFAFTAGGFVQAHIYPTLDPAEDYAIRAVVPNITSLMQVRRSQTTFWGVPGDPAHAPFRYRSQKDAEGIALGAPFEGAIRPLLTLPMDCGEENGGTRIRLDSYNHPGQFTAPEEYPEPLNVEDCDDPRFRFEPKVSLQPTSRAAGAPTGLDVHLEVPQRDDAVKDAKELYADNGDVQAIATPPVKEAVVTLPEGMTLNPSAAQGLGACSSEQIGLGTDSPVSCPDSSQYGTLTLHTPFLPVDKQPTGQIYIAKQADNPFHSFLALYMVIQEPDRGLLVKLPGRVDLDPDTGQITTSFEDLPQFPVDDFQLALKGGVRAGLVNPATCGTKTITAEFFSWHDPGTPQVVEDSYQVTQKPDGSPCVNSLAERPFTPQLRAETLNPLAGSYSPFFLRLTRTDDDQEFSQLGVSLPQGLIAKIAGIAECPQAAIAQAIARTRAGEGALELASPSCPAASYIGSTNVGAGVGVPLTYVPGRLYLAGPYQGAPLSMVAITPAVVGPFDLGVIAVRSAIHVERESAAVSVFSDPLPLIYQGIPVRIRDIRVAVDRPETTLNPTDCAEKQITARITGTGGEMKSTADDTAAQLSQRFQAAECASLGFKPKLSFRLFGGTKRGAHPKLRAVLRMPESDNANMARAAVALPRSEFLDQGHIRTVCTRVQFAAEACPQGSIYGFARAKTPLLEEPLKGPVYLRSSSHKLPDLVIALKGRIDVDVVGRIDSVRGGLRSTFAAIPDAPVSWFVLTMQGGKKGLFVNSRNLCKSTVRATAKFRAQNGRKRTLRPKLRTSCKKQRKGKRRARHSRER